MTEKLITVEEAAKYLDIHPVTLYRWSRARKIPAMKMGKVWRFKRERLDAWLEKQENIR